MASALPSNALYDVQKYLRQKRATGAQVTPQSERAAWSGYFDTMEQNSLAERASAMNQERLNMMKDAQKAQEGAATISGIGQLVSTAGQGAMLLKGTDIGSKIGLGPSTTSAASKTTPTATVAGAAPPTVNGAAAPIGAGAQTGLVADQAAVDLAANMSAAPGVTGAVAESGGGMLTAASPYLGPAGVGFATGSLLPNVLGIKNETGRMAAGAAGGALTGAATGAAMGGEIGTTIGPGYGTAVGAIIGAIAGGIGAKVGK